MPQASQRMTTRSQDKVTRLGGRKGDVTIPEKSARKTGGVKKTAVIECGNAQPSMEPTRIVYLEPIDYESPIPNHPLDVGKLLYDGGFSKCKEIQKIGRFRYKLELERAEDFNQLREVDIASKNLKFYAPKLRNETLLFVPNVPLEYTEEDLTLGITTHVPVKKVERIKRKNRTGDLVNSRNVKVTVEGTEVPRSVKIFTVNFRAELYVFPVKQCLLCWRFGHTKVSCTGKAKCVNCGQHHDAHEECEGATRCINCNQNHPANSRECPERERRSKILKVMQCNRVPFAEAEKSYPKTQNRFSGLLDESEFPDLTAVETPTSPSRGAVPKTTRRIKTGHQVRRRSNETGRTSQSSSRQQINEYPANRSRPTECSIAQCGNPHRATEFERFMDRLRADIRRFCSGNDWMTPIAQLRNKLEARLQQDRTEIETDQLLIEISIELGKILEGETASEMEHQNNTLDHHNGP